MVKRENVEARKTCEYTTGKEYILKILFHLHRASI